MKTSLFFAAAALCLASCGNNQEAEEKAAQARIDSLSGELARQRIVDSMNAVMAAQAAATVEPTPPPVQSRRSSTYRGSNSRASYPEASAPATPPPVAASPAPGLTAAEYEAQRKAENKKKLKSAGVGAAIGAGAGAIGGALSNKDPHFKKENAAIGAGVGAAVGAGAGLLLQNRKLKKAKDTTE